jgi:hypothetical protein
MPALSTSTTSHEFPRFLEFPFEIREYIWEYAIAQPRVIQVQVSESEHCRAGHSWFSYKDNNPPALLSVCTESRKVAHAIYSNLNPTYFRPERDILRFMGWEALGMHALYVLCMRPHEIGPFIHTTYSKEAQGACWLFEEQEEIRPTKKADERISFTHVFRQRGPFSSDKGHTLTVHPMYRTRL